MNQPDTEFMGYSRLAVFIDGVAFHAMCCARDRRVEWETLLRYLRDDDEFASVHYFTAVAPQPHDDDFHRTITWMGHNGFTVHAGQARVFPPLDGVGDHKIKRPSRPTALAVVAMRTIDTYDRAIIIGGDIQYTELVRELCDQGKFVTVISTQKTDGVHCANQLLREASEFVDLSSIEDEFTVPFTVYADD